MFAGSLLDPRENKDGKEQRPAALRKSKDKSLVPILL